MNFTAIKQMIKENGDKCILVENDEPEYVLMSFREYRRLTGAEAREPHRVASAIAVNDMLERSVGSARSPDRDFSEPMKEPRAGDIERRSAVEFEQGAHHDYPLRLEDIRLEDLPI